MPVRSFSFSDARFVAAVTTRHGGVSAGPYASLNLGDHVGDRTEAVAENRRRVCDRLCVDRLTVADQQHGARVAVVDRTLAGKGHEGDSDARTALPATDALVTDLPGVALAVMVADCAPVTLVDPVTGAVGVAHCGRNGVLRQVLVRAVETMTGEFGTRPGDLFVGIGPHIAADSYEVGQAQAEEARAVFPGLSVVRPTRPGHFSFDIRAALLAQLRWLGVPAERIEVMDVDTYRTTAEFFSDRAERPCGRFMAIVARR